MGCFSVWDSSPGIPCGSPKPKPRSYQTSWLYLCKVMHYWLISDRTMMNPDDLIILGKLFCINRQSAEMPINRETIPRANPHWNTTTSKPKIMLFCSDQRHQDCWIDATPFGADHLAPSLHTYRGWNSVRTQGQEGG